MVLNVKDLDGVEYELKIKDNGRSRENKSSYHRKALQITKQLYPAFTILEEIPVKIKKNTILYFDILILERLIFLEVQGQQHYSFSQHFHGNKYNYLISKTNDLMKKNWAKLNDLEYIELNYKEIDSWADKIIGNNK